MTLEQRGSLFGSWTGDRGRLDLQPFVEMLMRQATLGLARGVTEQARVLLGRTAVDGHLRLGDGRVEAPGLQVELKSEGHGQNALQLRSSALGRGLSIDLPALSARDASASRSGWHLVCEQLNGDLRLQLAREPDARGEPTRFTLASERLSASGIALTTRA